MASKKLERSCCTCREIKTAECFNKSASQPDGLHPQCKDCRRAKRQAEWAADPEAGKARNRANYLANRDVIRAKQREYYHRNAADLNRTGRAAYLARNYGITPAEYDALNEGQGGLCGICGKAESDADPRTGTVRSLAVDHDHETGRIRGLLCRKCNTAIGLLGDSAEALRAALAYLDGVRL